MHGAMPPLELSCRVCEHVCLACRYLQDDQAALYSLLEAENTYAEAWLQPMGKLQQQLHKEIMQASPQEQVCIPFKASAYACFEFGCM